MKWSEEIFNSVFDILFCNLYNVYFNYEYFLENFYFFILTFLYIWSSLLLFCFFCVLFEFSIQLHLIFCGGFFIINTSFAFRIKKSPFMPALHTHTHTIYVPCCTEKMKFFHFMSSSKLQFEVAFWYFQNLRWLINWLITWSIEQPIVRYCRQSVIPTLRNSRPHCVRCKSCCYSNVPECFALLQTSKLEFLLQRAELYASN